MLRCFPWHAGTCSREGAVCSACALEMVMLRQATALRQPPCPSSCAYWRAASRLSPGCAPPCPGRSRRRPTQHWRPSPRRWAAQRIMQCNVLTPALGMPMQLAAHWGLQPTWRWCMLTSNVHGWSSFVPDPVRLQLAPLAHASCHMYCGHCEMQQGGPEASCSCALTAHRW